MKRSTQFLKAMAAYDSDDESLALRLMEECAGADEPVACFMMALWCAGKEGMPVGQERSARWLARFEELAEDDNLEAQWDLGQNHRFANFVPQNNERANYWLERCAKGGYAEAQHHLAWYYETGQYDYPVNRAAADRWYQKAFEQQHPETLYLFALRQFKDGQPTPAALELLRKAADKGSDGCAARHVCTPSGWIRWRTACATVAACKELSHSSMY